MLVFKCYDCETKLIPGPSVSVMGSNCQMCGGRVKTYDERPPAPTPPAPKPRIMKFSHYEGELKFELEL